MPPPVTLSTVLPDDRGALVQPLRAWVRPFDASRERVVSGWLRIAFFSSILFNHTVFVRFEFLDERMWVVWAQLLRDFGTVGFFLLAGVALKGKVLANPRATMPSNLLKLAIAAAVLAAFEIAWASLKGEEPGEFGVRFYAAIYETNLWFFVAYAFAGPMLLSMNRRAVFGTVACCLVFVMYPAEMPLASPLILQTISLAFVCMAIGMELHGHQANPWAALAVAVVVYLVRVWTDDFGLPDIQALDIVLRIVYGVACYFLLKALADRLCGFMRSPAWANYLFVPYLVQFPIIKILVALAAVALAGSFEVRMPPIFDSFGAALAFDLAIFTAALVASLALAWFLSRYRIRV